MTRINNIAAFLVTLIVVWAVGDIAYAQLQNPTSIGSIQEFVSKVLKAMVMVAVPIIALFLVYSGFMFVLAQGNEEKLSKAKMNFLYVIIGAILILGAWVFASLLGNTITSLTS